MMRKICKNCGTPPSGGDLFCRRCGGSEFVVYDPPAGKGRSIGSFLIWLAVYFGVQTYVSVAFIVFSIREMHPTFEGTINYLVEVLEKKTVLISVVSSFLFIAVYLVVTAIRQGKRKKLGSVPARRLFRETGFRGAPAAVCLFSVVLGAALNVVISFVVAVIPWPDFASDSFDQTYSVLSADVTPLWLIILAVAVCAPLCEELLFRGIGCSRLTGSFPKAVAVIITSAVFGVVHGTPIAIAYATVFGVIQAFIFLRHRSLLPVVLCHFGFNFTSVFLEYLPADPALNLGVLFICAAAALGTGYLILKKSETAGEENESL